MTQGKLLTPVLIAGCRVRMTGFAIRASFGVFQILMATTFNGPRSGFSLAIARGNLAWGIGRPIFGRLAERVKDRRAMLAGAIGFAAGLVLSSFAALPVAPRVPETLVGSGIAGTGLGVIPAVMGRASLPENRSIALGSATAAGSAAQVIGVGALFAIGLLPIRERSLTARAA